MSLRQPQGRCIVAPLSRSAVCSDNLPPAPGGLFFWQALFIMATVGIVIGGIRGGIERWSKILMPGLFALLILLFLYAMFSPGGPQALRFMFCARIFPTYFSIGTGCSWPCLFYPLFRGWGDDYLRLLPGCRCGSVRPFLEDRFFSIRWLPCWLPLPFFRWFFSAGMPIGGGPGLVFETLPILFMQLPFGQLWALVFFLLLAFAALTSAISMLEVVVAYVIDEYRWRAFAGLLPW